MRTFFFIKNRNSWAFPRSALLKLADERTKNIINFISRSERAHWLQLQFTHNFFFPLANQLRRREKVQSLKLFGVLWGKEKLRPRQQCGTSAKGTPRIFPSRRTEGTNSALTVVKTSLLLAEKLCLSSLHWQLMETQETHTFFFVWGKKKRAWAESKLV